MAIAALLYVGTAVPGSHAYDGNEMTAASALLPRTRLRSSLELIHKQDADILSLKAALADLTKAVEEGQAAHRLDKVVIRKLEGDVVQLQRTQPRAKEEVNATPLQRRRVVIPQTNKGNEGSRAHNAVSATQAKTAVVPKLLRRPAKFLLLSALPTSFASGLKYQIHPFLAMAAAYGRTAVLPAASFGHPAFRTASGMVPFEELVDVDSLRRQFPCVRLITYADWRNLTESTVDSLLFLGTEDEIGRPLEGAGAAGKLSPDDEPVAACYPAFLKDIRNAVAAGADTHAGRSHQVWDFSSETKHVVASERLRVRRVKCASTQSLVNATRVLSAATGALRDDQSVMIANFPGMRKGPFVWSTSWKSEVRRLFKDVPERLCYTTVDSRRLKYFELAQAWKSVADEVVERRFGGDFSCIHMRTEKLILSGLSAGWGATATEVLQSASMHRCMRAVVTLIRRRGKSSLFLLTDLSTAAGSASAANKVLSSWVSRQETELMQQFGPALGFCGTDDEVRARTSGPRSVQRALRRDPRNCAAVEAAVCQKAQAHLRFGEGMMGEYATGYSGDLQQYATCRDVFAALDIPM